MGRQPEKYAQATRLLRMLDELRLHHAGMSLAQLAERFGCSERNVRRDLEALEVAGYATETLRTPGERARVRLCDPPLRSVQLSLRERYALLAVRRVFDALEHTPLFEDVRSVYAKVANTLPVRERRQLDEFGERFAYLPDGGTKRYARKKSILDALLSSVLYRTRLDYSYESQREKRSKGIMEPYAMVLYRHGLYVIGRPEGASGGPRVFAAERFLSARHRRGDHFEVAKGFHVDRYFQGAFGIFVGDKPTSVTVEFSKEVRDTVEARLWHPQQKLQRTRTGGVRLAFEVSNTAQVLPWVLSWGTHAKLLEPPALAEELARIAQEIGAR